MQATGLGHQAGGTITGEQPESSGGRIPCKRGALAPDTRDRAPPARVVVVVVNNEP